MSDNALSDKKRSASDEIKRRWDELVNAIGPEVASVAEQAPGNFVNYLKGVGKGTVGMVTGAAQQTAQMVPGAGPFPNPFFKPQASVEQAKGTVNALKNFDAGKAKEAIGNALQNPEQLGMAASSLLYPNKLNELGPMREMTAYHGTPHTFEPHPDAPLGKFDLSKIGTGEGAQAFGHGLYVAENPQVAKQYQYMLSKVDPENVSYAGKSAEQHYADAYALQDKAHRLGDKNLIDQANAQATFWEGIMTRRHPEDMIRMANDPEDGWPTLKNYANSLDKNKFKGVGNAGSLYHVDIPDEHIDKMLDWDKPLSEQHPDSVRALESIPFSERGVHINKDNTVSDLLNGLTRGKHNNQNNAMASAGASERLRAAGIPGIKYLDAGSRGAAKAGQVIGTQEIELLNKMVEAKKAGDTELLASLSKQLDRLKDNERGSRNLVLFDPSIATITKKE